MSIKKSNTSPLKSTENPNPFQSKEDTISLETMIINQKKQLVEQIKRVDDINMANKEKIAELQNNIDKSGENLDKIVEIDSDIKKMIDNHKKSLQNPEKTKETIVNLENELSGIENKITEIIDNCTNNMNSYKEYLNRFL